MNDLSMSNPKTKLTLWVVLILILAVVFYWFLIKPQFAQINTLKSQIMTKEQKLATLLLAQKREKELLAENRMMQERIAELQKILPVSPDEFLFGEEFQVVAKLCGVNIDSLTFVNKKPKGAPQNSVSFQVSVSANKLDNIRYFLIHIGTFPQIINVDSLSLQKGSSKSGFRGGFKQAKGSSYSANINGIIYLSQRK